MDEKSDQHDIKRLSAAISHDFNNHLAVILTAAAYVLESLDERHQRLNGVSHEPFF